MVSVLALNLMAIEMNAVFDNVCIYMFACMKYTNDKYVFYISNLRVKVHKY